MSVDTIRLENEENTDHETSGGIVDVTGVRLRNLEQVVQGHNAIALERHRGRTYVITDED